MRCAIYARYSSDRQNPRSIEDQIRKCRQYAETNGWDVLDGHIYSDEAVSGAMSDRAGYQRLLRIIEKSAATNNSPFDAVLAEDTSRLWRDQEEQARAIKLMKFAGIRLLGCDGTDSASPSSTLFLGIKGLMNQEYRVELAERTKRGLRGTAEEGLHTGGRCFGYRSVHVEEIGGRTGHSKRQPTKLVQEPEEAAIVMRIFEMYADGYSLKGIAKKLNAERVPSPRPALGRIQQSWCPSSIRTILNNDRYRGVVTFGKTRKVFNPLTEKRIQRGGYESDKITREFPEQCIVSKELWQRAQTRKAEKKSTYGERGHKGGLARAGYAAGNPYLFSGLMKCSECGARLTIVSGRGKNHGQPHYGCPMNAFRNTCSNNLRIRRDALEQQLLSKLQTEVLRQDVVDYALGGFEAEIKKVVRDADGQVARLEQKKRNLELELRHLVKAIATGFDSPAVHAEIKECEKQISDINSQVFSSRTRNVQTKIREGRRFVEASLKDVRRVLNMDPATAKAALARHMPQIVLAPSVHPDGSKFFRVTSNWELLHGSGLAHLDGAEGQS